MSVQTRSGASPVEDEVRYGITTEEAEEFLQKKFDTIVSMMRKNGEQQDDVKIMLFTTRCSRKFMPFMILLPTNVLQGKKERRNDHEADIFNPESSTKVAKLKDPFHKLIGAFTYNKNDESGWFSNQTRQALGISIKTSHELKANRIPKIQRLNKGQNEFVVCLIDPIRLFHDMLVDIKDPKTRFNVFITSTNQIKSGTYSYEVSRVLAKNKKKGDKSYIDRLAYEVNQRVNG